MRQNRSNVTQDFSCGRAASNHARLIVKYVAIAFAFVFGLIALYYCLLPALAENTGGNIYVYFDNGLSQYDEVYYSTNGTDYTAMIRLSSSSDKNPPDMTNVNSDKVYVTPSAVASGTTVYFRGVADGRVYDTVTNYRINAASREWGYDYYDFTWTSQGVAVSDANNCYYAPPQLMEYRYAGVAATTDGGDKSLVQYIYAHGERDANGNVIAKPEQDDSIIQPNTATNRTFYDAEYVMEGYLSSVNGKNTLGNLSQIADNEGSFATGNGDRNTGSSKVYHASADFYDYYSDWELAGNTLEDHIIAYGFTDAETTNYNLYSTDFETSSVVYTNSFPTDAEHGFTAANGASIQVGRYDYNHGTDDGTNSLFIYNNNTNPRAGLAYEFTSDKLYSASVWAWPHWTNENATMRIVLEYINSSNATETVTLTELPVTYSGGWTQIVTPLFRLPDGCSNPILYFEAAGKKNVHIDDVSITEINSKFDIVNGTDKLAYAANGYNGSEASIYVDNASNVDSQLSFDVTGSWFSNKEVYSAEAYINPDSADEIIMTVDLLDASGNVVTTQQVASVSAEAGEWIKLAPSVPFEYPIDYDSAVIHIDSKNGSSFYVDDFKLIRRYFNPNGSFSEGTNRISYSYQGLHWNYAISDYYTGTSGSPLYFGSNSWMTGNGRYNLVDRHGLALFTQDEVTSGNIFVKWEGIHDDRQNLPTDGGRFGAYLYPFDRQYFKNLFGFNQDANNPYLTVDTMNYPLGQSNSRGVPGLVDLENGGIQLKNTDKESPYFNEAFIEGDNEANAVYGKVYNDVKFDFKFNEETGYYEYDSTDYKYATRITQNTNDNSYYMRYTNSGVTKADADDEDKNGSSQTVNQFYPFNSTDTNDSFATENLMFGMKLNIPFTMFKDIEKRNDSVFKFSGDDDVWVYVDDQLVLDIGGTHTAVGGVVDLRTGYAVVGSTFDANTGEVVFAGSSTDWTNFVNGDSAADTGVSAVEKAAFAIGTQDGVKAVTSWTHFDEAAFFDDVYTNTRSDYGYKTIIDEENGLYKVMYRYNDENGDTQEGAAVFKLFKFELTDDGLGGDLQQHNLDIYYMERGLNSSNFKLAFNFVENTEREVEKEWADGADAHNNGTDSVTVELYRTEPTLLENQIFNFPSGYSVIRSVAYKADNNTAENTAFAKTSDNVTVQFKPADESVANSAMVLTLNGMPLSYEVYSQLSASSAGLKVYINDVEVTEADFQQGTGDLANYLVMPVSDERNRVNVKFNPVSRINAGTPTEEYNTWGLVNSNGWLVEAHAFNLDDSTQIDVAEQKIPSHSNVKTLTAPVSGDQPARELIGEDMRFFIVKTINGVSLIDNDNAGSAEAYQYIYYIKAVPETDNFNFYSVVNEGSVRTVTVEQREWNGYNNTAAYDTSKSGDYGGSTAATDDLSISIDGGENASDYEIIVYARNAYNRYYVINGITLNDLYSVTAYSNAHYVSTVTLNQNNNWNHVWDNIIESITVNGEEKNYNYFIREATVNGVSTSDESIGYQTEYLDKDGNVIQPEYIECTLTDDEGNTYVESHKLYSIDNGENYIRIVNAPKTDIKLSKIWSSSAVQQDVTIDIYSSYDGVNGEYVQSAVLSSAEKLDGSDYTWEKVISNLPLYKKVGTEWKKLTYYAVEQKLTYTDGNEQKDYIVSYNPPTAKVLTLSDSSTITVYEFNMTAAIPSIGVTNRANNSGEFVLQIHKTSVLTGYPELPDVTYKLWKLTDGTAADGTYIEIGTDITDENGMVDFGAVEGGFTYKITEEDVPLGFKKDSEPIIFYIEKGEDNVLIFDKTNKDYLISVGESYIDCSWENDVLKFDLRNETQPIIMPTTGGTGVKYILIYGVIIILMALTGVLVWQKSGKKT